MEQALKRILVFGMSSNYGGIESVIMNYYRNINKSKIQFDFITVFDNIAYEKEIKKLGGNIYKIAQKKKNYFIYKKELRDFFRKHSKEYCAFWFNVCSLVNIDYLKYAKKYGIKIRIVHSHNSKSMSSKRKIILHLINKRKIEKYATDFWACSLIAGKYFYNKKILNLNKFKIINNAIDVEKFAYNEETHKINKSEIAKMYPDAKINNKTLIVGNIGRFHLQKNHEFLIDIFNEINQTNNNSVLMLIGDGSEKEKIINKVNQLNLEKKVLFLGIRSDVSELLKAMDIFVMPSLFEGLSVVCVEAQASGLLCEFSDRMTNETKILESTRFISLNKSSKEWSKIILDDYKKFVRKDTTNEMTKANFNIKEEVKKFENFFKV